MDTVHEATELRWSSELTPEAASRWLVRLWWTTAFIETAVVLAAFVLPPSSFRLRRVAPLVAASALLTIVIAYRASHDQPRLRLAEGFLLLLLGALLTGLLELSGGPSNPFSVIYVVLIALAAVTLGRSVAVVTAAWTLFCYGLLIYWHLNEVEPEHHRLLDFPTHLFTMWLAIAALAELAGHFAGAAARAIARRERQIDAMRQQAARAQRLMALTTLAAGAAHELSTPLATIAIAAKELERALARLEVPDACGADARLIREEVDRCQLILDQMSGRAGGSAAEDPETVGIDDLLTDVKARLPADRAARLQAPSGSALPTIVVPRAGLIQVLLSLIKNAFDATDGAKPVMLAVEHERDLFRFVVHDDGSGMSPDALRHAGEPFYTTKPAGHGFGLGLFLARVFAERCGGSLTLQSGRGTTAVLTLPAAPTPLEAA